MLASVFALPELQVIVPHVLAGVIFASRVTMKN